MSASRGLPCLLVLGFVVAACGATPAEEEGVAATTGVPATTSTETPTPSTSVRRDVVSTGELHVIVAPDENGEYPPDLIVTCPHGPRFPLGALDRIAPISDDDPDGMLAAIAVFLDSEEGAFWPQEGWQLLHQGAQEAILVSRFEPGLAFVFLDKDQNAWVWGGSSIPAVPCDLQYTVPAGLHHVEWRLDPSVPDPGPHDTELRVVLTESACVSGQKIGDRLVGPQTVITATSVRIAFAATPPPGDAFDCPGNPETPYTVQLPQPLGDRKIIEAMSIGLSLEDYVT